MIIFLAAAAILLLPFRLRVELSGNIGELLLVMKLSRLNLRVLRKKLRPLQLRRQKENRKKLEPPFWLAKVSEVRELHLHIRFGSGDAAATAVLTGALRAAAESFFCILARRFSDFPKPPYVKAEPDFSQKRFDIELYCIMRFSLGNIIFGLLKHILQRLLQNKFQMKESRV